MIRRVPTPRNARPSTSHSPAGWNGTTIRDRREEGRDSLTSERSVNKKKRSELSLAFARKGRGIDLPAGRFYRVLTRRERAHEAGLLRSRWIDQERIIATPRACFMSCWISDHSSEISARGQSGSRISVYSHWCRIGRRSHGGVLMASGPQFERGVCPYRVPFRAFLSCFSVFHLHPKEDSMVWPSRRQILRARQRPSVRLSLESLERRHLPSVSVIPFTHNTGRARSWSSSTASSLSDAAIAASRTKKT